MATVARKALAVAFHAAACHRRKQVYHGRAAVLKIGHDVSSVLARKCMLI